jgi:hypothetical protein
MQKAWSSQSIKPKFDTLYLVLISQLVVLGIGVEGLQF